MRAIHLTAYGNPAETLKYMEVPVPPAPAPHQALIQMEFSPVNFSDILLASGIYAVRPNVPAVVGNEGVGTVLSVGKDVTNVKAGDRVTLPFGTFAWAEWVLATAKDLFIVPQEADVKQAAMLSINPPTAVLLLEEFVHLQAGDWVVFNAANSSVGQCLTAVAKSRGIKTVGIVRRQEVVQQVKDAGTDIVLVDGPDVQEQLKAIAGEISIRLGLEAVGGDAINTLAGLMAEDGHIVSYANITRQQMLINQVHLIFRRLNVHGMWMYSPQYLSKLNAAKAVAANLIVKGDLNVKIAATYPLSAIKEAIEHTLRGGKILLDFNA